MATLVPFARVPFAPLDNPRLQHLASAKNRQNGLIAQKSSMLGGKSSNATPVKSILSPSPKRPYEPSIFEDFGSENVDPAAAFSSPSKKSKNDAGETPTKPFTFSLATPMKSMPPPQVTPAKASISSPRAPLTAPAGRSPKRKSASGISKTRRLSAPFTRIDPPFASRTNSTLPFSLDAALSSTFSSSSVAAPTTTLLSAGATIQESMPKGCFFDIYEDTPEEEAANLMEHSTLTLDLSSDDESSKKDAADERGKENMPPADYDAPARMAASVLVRTKIIKEEMDEGLRTPLSDLETEPFIPEGLDTESVVVVAEVGVVGEAVEEKHREEKVEGATVAAA